MLFVPVPVTPSSQPLSPRARELGDLLGRVIEEYEAHHPAVTGPEVRQALRLASARSSASSPPVAQLAVAVAAGVLALGGVLLFLVMDRGATDMAAVIPGAVAGVIFAVLLALLVVHRSREV